MVPGGRARTVGRPERGPKDVQWRLLAHGLGGLAWLISLRLHFSGVVIFCMIARRGLNMGAFRYLFLIAALVALVHGEPATAQKRVALVMGNSAYRNVPRLRNPARDAQAIAVLLQSGGFDTVHVHQDDQIWLVDEEKLVASLRAGRNLSKDEWARFVDPDTPRQPSCRNLPSNWRQRR